MTCYLITKFHLRTCCEDLALAAIPPTLKASTHNTDGSVGPRISVDWWRKYTTHNEIRHPRECTPQNDALFYGGHMINTCCVFLGEKLIAFVRTLLHSCYILFFTELLLTSS